MISLVLHAVVAQAACPGAVVALSGEWPAAIARSFEADLRVELERNQLCTALEGQPPARIDAAWSPPSGVTMVVTFQHGDIERQLKRRFSGDGLPSDAFALTLAAVAGELIDEVRQVIRPEVVPEPVFPANALVLRVVGDGFTGGLLQGGGELAFRRAVGPLFVGAGAGVRSAVPLSSTAGTVRATTATVSAEVGWHFVKSPRWWAGLGALVDAGSSWLTPEAAPGFVAKAATTAFTVSLSGTVSVELHLSPALFVVRLGAGAPLRGYRVVEANGGAAGAQLSASLAGGLEW